MVVVMTVEAMGISAIATRVDSIHLDAGKKQVQVLQRRTE